MNTAIDIMSHIELNKLKSEFLNNKPFDHVIIDNFLDEETAKKLADEFPTFNDDIWYKYDNQLEIKRASNNWNIFKQNTYQYFTKILSDEFTKKLSNLSDTILVPDIGLHGGGFHSHSNGGKLNPHLDYSIHPKIGLQRRINIILYINPDWKPEYGGSLGFWEHNKKTNRPGKLIREIDCLFNRAVIFNTIQNSWHGITKPIKNDKGLSRNSLATYYLAEPKENFDPRMKVKFAPTENQKNNKEIEDLINARQSMETFKNVYRNNETK